MSQDLILVTGGSGFVAIHCIDQLLRAGYDVRTTVRSLTREPEVRDMLENAGSPRRDALRFVEADLTHDKGWVEAVIGCRFVLHVASPFPPSAPNHEDDLIIPAREGALRVLRAARDASVERVVLTSSFAAIGYGHMPQTAPFDETTWTNVDAPGISAYAKSKTLAERAAWDFIKHEGGNLELSVVNPVGVFGPTFGPDYSTSILIVQRLLDGAIPVCPRIGFGAVDVRDVADLHLRAMTNQAARGERFLAVAGKSLSLLDVARILKIHMGPVARRVPTRELPDWIVRFSSLFIPDMKAIAPELGNRKNVSNEKAKRILGWIPRTNEEAITASGESLASLGLVKT
ncbi:NADPH-dependent methylglyoxal reductase (D-lactaldehyde dehydrogenase) [Acidisarcina polymorpha]|uniref:NADPH-dependent methylglyoxal reductase (D-lactaldehyde dehydrogenase) n=1 Tax=Acidisarcina polymorpha TaxID=2211140 RepID=A0A2Z5G4E0_9BACT|nr:aldehyde reductase [Acidisarcina polymorpha]AXC14012.1 NADPH-dependent methylglyoxal reductase (D-lactaldehyde dehydrogenase) [Acidisarcina polymorpha]